LVHVANAFEVAGYLSLFAKQLRFHLLGIRVDLAGLDQALKLLQPLEPLADRAKVRERAAQPALGDERHADVLSVFLDRTAGLSLGTDKDHVLAFGDGSLNELLGKKQTLD